MRSLFFLTVFAFACQPAEEAKPTQRADTSNDEPPPTGDATVEVTNLSGYDIYYLYQCDYSSGDCYDALGADQLADGGKVSLDLEAGAWFTLAIDEDDYCDVTELYELESDGEYYWKITDLYGWFDWDSGLCNYDTM